LSEINKFVLVGEKEGAGVVRNSLLVAAVFIAFLFSSGNAKASGHIYLLRGLASIFPQGWMFSTKNLFNVALLRPSMVTWIMKSSRGRRPVCKKAAKVQS
jgi:hypothetical protein